MCIRDSLYTIDIEDIENTLDYGVYTSAQPMTIHDSIIESIPYRFLEECYGKTSFETMW